MTPSGPASPKHVAFYHPFCNSGGGGERVLWKFIHALGHDLHSLPTPHSPPRLEVVIYTCETASASDIFKNVGTKFQLSVPPSHLLPIRFVRVPSGRALLSASSYPRLTMFGQSLGAVLFLVQALWSERRCLRPDVFVDTTGCAFLYPVVKVLTMLSSGRPATVLSYTHYPTISTDMLRLVYDRRPSYNNSALLARSTFVTVLKLLYYVLFALVYGLCGSCADTVMVNSSWTCGHVSYLFRLGRKPTVVYPPCDVSGFAALPLAGDPVRLPWILSVGQFRPEKDHELQLRAFKALLDRRRASERPGGGGGSSSADLRLVLLGSCRDEGDAALVASLKDLATLLGIGPQVDFVVNGPYATLRDLLSTSSIGIHTMWNEHFGIGVVEMMAAGLITIAHNSGGPKTDIIGPTLAGCADGATTAPGDDGSDVGERAGFLASDEKTYADMMERALNLTERQAIAVRLNARKRAKMFSDEDFVTALRCAIAHYF